MAPAPSNDNTLTAFLSTLNGANPQPGAKATQLLSYFCKDSVNPPPPKQFPSLGITDHGPAFFGQVELTNFFTQLFTTFPDMQWKDLSPRLTAPNEIGIQMNVTGSYAAQWFQHKQGTKSHFSLPLSQLPNTPGNPLGRFALDTNGLPAFAVFFFQDKTWLIQQLQIYLDRYAMMQSIGIDWTPDGTAVPHRGAMNVARATTAGQGRRITITIED